MHEHVQDGAIADALHGLPDSETVDAAGAALVLQAQAEAAAAEALDRLQTTVAAAGLHRCASDHLPSIICVGVRFKGV
jgi:hypothetical protein